MLGRAATVLSAALYLLFLALWGLNYQRRPITAGLQFDAVDGRAHRDVPDGQREFPEAP